MCGIIGTTKRISRGHFLRARDTMYHRGPDSAGLLSFPDSPILLGHRRLAIIDTKSTGNQPMSSRDGRYHIVFNGEIYNYRELRNDLRREYQFQTESDTEVLLAAYSVWGKQTFDKLIGMFAFVIWDKVEGKLIIVRDRLGIKPLYFVHNEAGFSFASEIKALLALDQSIRKINYRGLLQYLNYRYVFGAETLYEGIFSLKPGHIMEVRDQKIVSLVPFWQLPQKYGLNKISLEEAIEETHRLLRSAVEYRMISDVPVGAYLSGGLDSSLLVSLMADRAPNRIKTFAISFADSNTNELAAARKAAEYLGTQHDEYEMGVDEYLKLLPEVIRFKDSPLHVPNEVPLYKLSHILKSDITVVLSGEGADELFGGYGRITRSGDDLLQMRQRDKGGTLLPELTRALSREYGEIPANEVDHFLYQYPYFPTDVLKKILNPNKFSSDILDKKFFGSFFSALSYDHPSNKYLHFFQEVHLLGILHRLDNATMGASVEGRVPYVDHRLVEFVSSLPLEYKIRWKSLGHAAAAKNKISRDISDIYDDSKYLLREIARRYLPTEIVERKKIGFPVPLENWASRRLNTMGRELLMDPQAKIAPLLDQKSLRQLLDGKLPNKAGRNLWALINIELWLKQAPVAL